MKVSQKRSSTLVSGIQPSGKLHIGNYLGTLKNCVELQNSGNYDSYFFIADLHALTQNPEAKDLKTNIENLKIDLLALGLDPKKSTLFVQSQISAHSELTWILNTLTPMGELERMTQFKDKSEAHSQNVNVGLFAYPVLMAIDILTYEPKFVPVGDDQLQHLELTRTLARKFNAKYGKTFIEPQPLLTKAPRVMSLDDPTKKMSKSRPAGCLFLDDSPEEIKKKIMRAVTDSGKEIKYDPENKPAISNLMQIASSLRNNESMEKMEKHFEGKSYVEFKTQITGLIADYFAPFRKKKAELAKKKSAVEKAFTAGTKKANVKAQKKLAEVQKKVGLA